MDQKLGIVIIGRNEGERLKRCLQSVLGQTDIIVYVDSGSSDGSVEYAESKGVKTIRLDMGIPFSAARARNTGCDYLFAEIPELSYVHFIDGDCELFDGWCDEAVRWLELNPACVVVAGRLKERFPEISIYNLLCDIEWDTPVGKVKSCGGIFTIRKKAFIEVQGFNPAVVAGEEPDLCYRLRQRGGEIHRIDVLMAKHDADMKRFSQWWRRSKRSGYGYALGYFLHKGDGSNICVRECLRIWLWAFLFPGGVFVATFFFSSWWSLGVLVYLFQFIKIFFGSKKKKMGSRKASIYAFFMIIIKWPQFFGQLLFLREKFSQKPPGIIEYR